MAKVILGKRPKHFKKDIKFPMLDGTIGSIEVSFVYRTRKEFGEYVDQLRDQARAKAEAEQKEMDEKIAAATARGETFVPDVGTTAMQVAITEANVEYTMGIINGWNLDIPLDREAVAQLADELPGALNAIIESYRLAITEGRLGN